MSWFAASGPKRFIAAGLLSLAAALVAYVALGLSASTPVFIHIRWSPDVGDAAREATVARYGLSQGERLEGRTWGYTLSDLSRANIRALVGDPAVEDTSDIDRSAFRVAHSAPKRPERASGSRLPLVLWGLTALCLVVGLTGVSLGLIQWHGRDVRLVAAGAAGAAGRITAGERLALLATLIAVVACFLPERTMDLRVDEGNHLAQIERYADGDLATNTGTSGGFHLAAALFKEVTGSSGKEGIRLFALLLSGVTVLAFFRLMRAIEPTVAVVRTLQFTWFPLLFPFWFLIYTDVLALMLLILAVLSLVRERHHVAGLLMVLSVTVRQTQIVWLALLGLWTLTDASLPLTSRLRRSMTFGVSALLFVAFVAVNGGVAVADRASHPDMELQTENLLFMLVCFTLMFLPLVVSKLREIVRLPPAIVGGTLCASAALFFGTFRVDHPWNVKWQDEFLRNALLHTMTSSVAAGAAASVAIALAVLSLWTIRLRQPAQYLVYPFAALSVLPVWLIEQRYYLPAYALFMAFRESASPRVERALLVVNIALALFFFEGIVAGDFFF